jgi:hypothetical protein
MPEQLLFHKYNVREKEKGTHHCTYIGGPWNIFPIAGVNSLENYNDVGKQMIDWLMKEYPEGDFRRPFNIRTLEESDIKHVGKESLATDEELIEIKKSLEDYVKQKGINLKFEIIPSPIN